MGRSSCSYIASRWPTTTAESGTRRCDRTATALALWFETDDFDEAVRRTEALRADVVRPPHRNPPEGPGGPAHRELWLRDPDGYLVVLVSPDGEFPWPDPRV